MAYQPDRRDFFGIIAAPLFRNIVPPTPMGRGGIVNPNQLAITHPHEYILQPAAVAELTRLMMATDDGHWSTVARITDISGPDIKAAITGPVEWS